MEEHLGEKNFAVANNYKNRMVIFSLLLSAKSSLFGLIYIMDLLLEYLFVERL